MAAHTDLDVLFKRLHLANARRVWRQMVERAERESWAYGDFLTLLATEEIAHRLAITQETARTHAKNAMNKLGARSRAHAVALALSRGELTLA